MIFTRKSNVKALIPPLLRAAAAFALTAGRLGGVYAPWALGAVAAAGAGIPGLAALLGTTAGALLFFDFQSGLRHIAAAILIFAALTAFYGSKLYTRPRFRPCVAGTMLALVQSVYLLGRSPAQWALCAAAAVTAALCAHGFAEPRSLTARTLFASAIANAAAAISVRGFSAGRVIGTWLALLPVGLSTPAGSAAIGGGIGLALDLVSGHPIPLYALAYALGTAAAALWKGNARPLRALSFCLCAAMVTLLFDADYPADHLAEALVGSAAWLLTPLRFRPKPLPEKENIALPPPIHQEGAAAFRALYDSFFRDAPPPHPENPSVLFDRAAELVCRRCVLCTLCWQKEYSTTYNAFNDACPALLQRGRGEPEDFPRHFADRCIHFPELLSAINAELYAFLLRRQYRSRLTAARDLARRQYAQMGELLSRSAHAVPAAAPAPPLDCRSALALRPKAGETVCGDQSAAFTAGALQYLLLSDGMGSGEAAHAEAAMTVRLLRQFLDAGIDAAPALKTLNTALTLRMDEGGGFTTIDLLELHRDGTAALYKYGAAPSYLKRNGSVTRFAAESLPAGLQQSETPPEVIRLTFLPGSVLVMVSDGIITEGDEWLQDLLAGWDKPDPTALCERIMAESLRHGGSGDDCAVLVMQAKNSGENLPRQV